MTRSTGLSRVLVLGVKKLSDVAGEGFAEGGEGGERDELFEQALRVCVEMRRASNASRRLILDAGARFGLNPEAPRVGLFAGMTVGLTKPPRR